MKIVFVVLLMLAVALGVTVVYQTTQQADINYYKGHRLFKKGKYKQAIALFERSLAADSGHSKALKEIAYSYQWTGNSKKAADTFRKILTKNSQDYKIKKSLAQVLSWSEEYKEAISLYNEIIGREDDNISRKRLAQVYIWNGRPKMAEEVLSVALEKEPDDFGAKLLFAKAKYYSGKAKEAGKIYEELLKEEIKEDSEEEFAEKKDEIKVHYADTLAADKKFDKAASLYRGVLSAKDNLEAKRKLADTLSWNKQYKQALELYDEMLKIKENAEFRVQKARILGWAKRYSESLREYEKALNIKRDEIIELEMKAKKAYWNNRVRSAIFYYKKLIKKSPKNVEAMFDLSQVYSYQSMYKQAIEIYENILKISPDHFRAKEGMEKIKLVSGRVSLNTKYEFFEADSVGRDTDINQSVFLDELSAPLGHNSVFNASHELARRSFSDFGGLLENKVKVGLEFKNMPRWQAEFFYGLSDFDRDVNELHTFGANLKKRFSDLGVGSFSFEREKLNNSSAVLRARYYKDNYNLGADFDISGRTKLGMDFFYSYYSDSNYKFEPSLNLTYYFFLEPKRLLLKYNCFYRNFDKKVSAYFSPKGFWTNAVALNWRHFLNKEEVFFGADNIYYDLTYKASADSRNIVSHFFGAELGWDINKRLNVSVKASTVNSSAVVYEDENIAVGLKYYF